MRSFFHSSEVILVSYPDKSEGEFSNEFEVRVRFRTNVKEVQLQFLLTEDDCVVAMSEVSEGEISQATIIWPSVFSSLIFSHFQQKAKDVTSMCGPKGPKGQSPKKVKNPRDRVKKATQAGKR